MSSPETAAAGDTQDRTDAGDGWVTGAWSTEGWMSATAPPPPPPIDDEESADGAEGSAAPEASDNAAETVTAEQPTAEKAEGASQRPEPAGRHSVVAGPAPADRAQTPAGTAADDDSIEHATTNVLPRPAGSGHAPPPLAPHAPYLATGAAPGNGLGHSGPPTAGPPTAAPARRAQSRPRPDAPSSAELTEDAIVRFRSDRPQSGWRRAVFTASGGMVNPGIGPVEKARRAQLHRIRRPLPGSHQIAVTSIKGGVGKTSVTACLGLVLAENRGDRVIALDANPDAGTLADRLTTETSVTVRNLIDNIEATHSLTDVARYTSLAGRLQVLASEQDPAMSDAFNRDEYERVCEVLTRYYNIVITDSGTGLVHSAMEGTLALADSLVVVGAPTVDGASRASKTLDWLIAHGHAAQVATAVIVLSCDRTSKEVDRGRIRSHFEARCRAVVEIPHDPHLAAGGRIQLERLRPPTINAFLTLAAVLADGFGGPVRTAETPADEVPSLG